MNLASQAQNHVTTCAGASLPATVTISGLCGQGVKVQLQAVNGEKGQFTANVVCVI
jgi:hypothetical protein